MQSRSKFPQTSVVTSKNKPKVTKPTSPASGDSAKISLKNPGCQTSEKLKSVTGKFSSNSSSTSSTSNKKSPEKLPSVQPKSNYSSSVSTTNSKNLTACQKREKLHPAPEKSVSNTPTSSSNATKASSNQNSKNNICNKSKSISPSKSSVISKACFLDKSGTPKSSGLSLSKECLEVLGNKFGKISSSIISLASSQKLVTVHSLECLLNREIFSNLADDVNNPEHAQGFFQITRGLIENLISKREEGNSKIQLITDKEKEKKYFIRADINTSVCYTDRYFKELVMNVLQSITSDEVEEEVTPKAVVRSDESKERLRLIRDMVRAEAGVEPEDFRQLERQLEQLRQSLTNKETEVDKASKEVEEFISQHTSDEEAYVDCLEIPQTAREAFKAYSKKHLEPKTSHKGANKESLDCTRSTSLSKKKQCKSTKEDSVRNLKTPSKNGTSKNMSLKACKSSSECEKIYSNQNISSEQRECIDKNENHIKIVKTTQEVFCEKTNSNLNITENDCGIGSKSRSLSENYEGMDSKEKYAKSLSILGEENYFEKGDSNATENIRPHMKKLVHDELLKIKNENILRNNRQIDRSQEVTPRSSFESLDFKSAASNISENEATEDETDEESTRMLIEYLKMDMAGEERKLTIKSFIGQEKNGNGFILKKIEEDENENKEREYSENVETFVNLKKSMSNLDDAVSNGYVMCKTFEEDFGPNKSNTIKEISIHNKSETEENANIIERVGSKWWTQNEYDVSDIFTEMKDAFEIIKDISRDILGNKKSPEQVPRTSDDAHEITDLEYQDYLDFTVAEMENVLMNISVKINELSQHLLEAASNISSTGKEQAQSFFPLSSKYMGGSHQNSSDAIISIKNEDIDTSPIKSAADTFLFLSETLIRLPNNIKSQQISFLNPPKSLLKTLTRLASTSYFKDCFSSTTDEKTDQNINNLTREGNIKQNYYFGNGKPRDDVLMYETKNNLNTKRNSKSKTVKVTDNYDKVYSAKRGKTPNNSKDSFENFEHFMGLTSSIMTVQNVSDMFMFLSAVLNDVPERLKSERILDLNPPPSLLRAIDILYGEENFDLSTDLSMKKSFASLTLQNVSDFLQSVSQTFFDVPERLKLSIIKSLDPPRSLLKAITLLTSLSHFSIKGSYSQEIDEDLYDHLDNQEKFFDAVSSIPSMS